MAKAAVITTQKKSKRSWGKILLVIFMIAVFAAICLAGDTPKTRSFISSYI